MIPMFLAGAAAGAMAARKRPVQTREVLEVLRKSGAEAVLVSVAAASLPAGYIRTLVAGSPLFTAKEV